MGPETRRRTRMALVALAGALSGGSAAAVAADGATGPSSPPRPTAGFTARRLRPRSHAVAPGTIVRSSTLFGTRVFSDGRNGLALADVGQAQYPARTTDGGARWRIDGPQLHVDAADGPEAVGSVGVASSRTLFAYGSSVVDVSTDAGRVWWETFLGGLVVAVVPGSGHSLLAYVQQSQSNAAVNPAVTWQYVSRDGGRHWRYSTALGGIS
ncbi:MAG: hypothetical protein ACRDMX_13885 [Solirubrobacteraceae bacterium]